jgi:hypothetical protein
MSLKCNQLNYTINSKDKFPAQGQPLLGYYNKRSHHNDLLLAAVYANNTSYQLNYIIDESL